MTLETFFEKFDQFADAPDAVAKMRELVLELAVRGRLLPSAAHPSDPSAPFPIPNDWKWSLIANVADTCGQKVPDRPFTYIDVGTIDNTRGLIKPDPEVVSPENAPSRARKLVRPGTVIYATVRPYLKNIAVIDREFVPHAIVSTAFAILNPKPFLDGRFLFFWLRSKAFEAQVAERMKGVAYPAINDGEFRACPIPLPPLAEQKRIVAKVDELMAVCDRLEAQQQERETRHAALARASLARFADAPTPANLKLIFHPSYSVAPADLRKSILTLAAQGKLVPQDPNDEPAEDLLARLEQERARIAKDQGVRPPKNVPPLAAYNYPHDIPESWQWSRIGHLALVIDYGTSQKADNDSSKVPVYRMGNIVGGRLVDENLKYVDASIDDLPGLYLKTDDILFNRTNSYELVGKAGIYTGPDDTATFASYLIRIRLPDTLLFPQFYSVAMNAPYYRQTQIEPEVVQQCGQANFNGTKLASTVVPLPPLAEQRRIVAKVEQLMALVDALETQLAASRATAANLLSALVAELTGTPNDGKVSVPSTATTGRRGRPRKSP